MIPKPFDYYKASSLGEAVELLRTKEDPKILAGGQSLVPLMKFRLASPKTLIDIDGIKGLDYIREEPGTIIIGALTRHDELANSELVAKKLTLLSDAANVIADQQVRNRGTIGGSIAHSDPTADLPTAIVASRANILMLGPNGSRSMGSPDFFQDYFATALAADEIVQEIRVPTPAPNSGTAYLKLSRRHGDFAIVGVAGLVTVDKDNVCTDASVVLGGVGAVPHHAEQTEKALVGGKLNDMSIENASLRANEGLKPPSDLHASSEYRLEMCRIMTKRTLKMAIKRCHGDLS